MALTVSASRNARPAWFVMGSVGLAVFAMFVLMRPDLIFTANTPTGGDMGAHVWLPAFVRDTLLPQGRIMGWANDWYAGFPALYFYFPLPILSIVALDVLMPYGVAFKLVTAAGVIALPIAAYAFVRSLPFSRAVSAVAGVAGGTYVLMESHNIFGGNVKATMAGEFSFSWGLALGLFYLAALVRNQRDERGFTLLPGVLLALTALSHIIVVMVLVVVSLPLLIRPRGLANVGGSWLLGFGITAFWSIPLLTRVLGYTADMGWRPVEGLDKVWPREFIPILILGVIGLWWSTRKGKEVTPAIWMAAIPLAGYLLFPAWDFTKLYNARLLPFYYLTIFIFAGVAVGVGVQALARWLPNRRLALAVGTVAASVLLLGAGLLGMAQIPGWVQWNYTGYEGKTQFQEYETLMREVDALPAGRVMWEANSDMGRYGTPMSLMLFPYWTEGSHPSMEGLYFESSITTPFHFLNAAEVSRSPSNPVSGLNYHTFAFDRALAHLPFFNVEYYVSFTEEARAAAEERGLAIIAEAPPWTIFELPPSELVEVASVEPVVLTEGDFTEAALEWYDRVDELHMWLAADGPETWPRVSELPESLEGIGRPLSGGTVSNITVEDDRVTFDTDAVGVPHLIKMSDFPNWRATGADGPYRAAPSFMIVVPTDEHVELVFARTADEYAGIGLTVLALIFMPLWRRRGSRSETHGRFSA